MRIGYHDVTEAWKSFSEPYSAGFSRSVGLVVQLSEVGSHGSFAVEDGRDDVVGYEDAPGEGVADSLLGLFTAVVELGEFGQNVVVVPDGVMAEFVDEGELVSPAVWGRSIADGRGRAGMEDAVARAIALLVGKGVEGFDTDAVASECFDWGLSELGAEGGSIARG